MRPMKNWKVERSRSATRREPYQKTSAMTKNVIACESEKIPLDQIAVLFERTRGSSSDSLYSLQQSSSRVSDATVRMAPAASQAS